MPRPLGKLTPEQYEIMEVVWRSAPEGATGVEIWEAIAKIRNVTRTTVLNMINRLQKRRWLKRTKVDNNFRYAPTMDRDAVSSLLAMETVDDYFGGSATNLVMSLLGSKKVGPQEIKRLRELLDDA
jgi:BlaI family penicillinase repressor